MTMHHCSGSHPAATQRHPEPDAQPHLSTRDLFGPVRKLTIEHEGQLYTLQLTRQNRLLLTK